MKLYAWCMRFAYRCARPLLAVWFGKKVSHRVRIAVRHKDQLLLVRTAFCSQRQYLPGGGIEHGETAPQAAVRELHEETGLRISIDSLHHIGEMSTEQASLPFHITLFTCEVSSLTLPPLTLFRKLEVIDRQWVKIADIETHDPVITWYLNRDQLC